MAKKIRHPKSQFHRTQLGRAQRYIRANIGEKLTLPGIAKEAGASSYHFARLFLAYTGETPFDYMRRIRLLVALEMLKADPRGPIAEIALSLGYDTPSAFNKVFKKELRLSPRDFRNLGKEKQNDLVYHLSQLRTPKEIDMKLTPAFEIVNRPATHFVFVEKRGPFSEVAPPTWETLFPLISAIDPSLVRGYWGLSTIDKTRNGEEAMIYEAGLALAAPIKKLPDGLKTKTLAEGKYARFLLTGPHAHVWPAFDRIFRTLAESKVELRPEFCIENYLNDPKVTPEAELLTELLVPVA